MRFGVLGDWVGESVAFIVGDRVEKWRECARPPLQLNGGGVDTIYVPSGLGS